MNGTTDSLFEAMEVKEEIRSPEKGRYAHQKILPDKGIGRLNIHKMEWKHRVGRLVTSRVQRRKTQDSEEEFIPI